MKEKIPIQLNPNAQSEDLDKAVEAEIQALQTTDNGTASKAAPPSPDTSKAKPKSGFFADVVTHRAQFSWDKKDPKSKAEPDPSSVPATVPASPTPDSQSYKYTPGDEFIFKQSEKKEGKKPVEVEFDDALKGMRDEVFQSGQKYSKVVGEVDARQGALKRALGKNPEKYQESQDAISEWKNKQQEFGKAFYKNIQDRLKSGEINPQYANEQTQNFQVMMAKHRLEVHGRKFDFKKDFSEGKNWLSTSVAKTYNNFIGKFRKMSFAKRAMIGTGIFAVGNIPVAMAWRVVGGLAAGKGAHEGLQAGAEWWRQRKSSKDIEKFEKDLERRNLPVEEKIRLRLAQYERENNGLEAKMKKYARGDYYRKFASVALAATVGTGTIAKMIQGTGLGGVIKEKLFGGYFAKPNISDQIPQAVEPSTGGSPGPESTKLPPEVFDEMQKAFDDPDPDKHIDNFAKDLNKMYSGGVEPDMKAGGVAAAAAEVQKPQFEEIGEVNIKEGGSMWKGIENSIRANPDAYGLDESDPKFKTAMNGKIAEMLHDFADKNGLTYKQLDKVYSGDSFEIRKDGVTGKIYLDDFQGKVFGGDFAQSAPVEEIASEKQISSLDGGELKVEDVKKPRVADLAEQPSKAAAVEKHSMRRAGGVKLPAEILEDERIAKKNFAEASQYKEDLTKFHKEKLIPFNENQLRLANEQMALSIRGSFDQIVTEAGIGKKAYFWGQPMSQWSKLVGEDYIAQDVQLTDEKLKLSQEKLKLLRPLLERYNTSGMESIDECLRKAVTDPTPVIGGKTGKPVGSLNMQFIREKILSK